MCACAGGLCFGHVSFVENQSALPPLNAKIGDWQAKLGQRNRAHCQPGVLLLADEQVEPVGRRRRESARLG